MLSLLNLLPAEPVGAILNSLVAVWLLAHHQSLSLNYLFCIMGMVLTACCGGMLRFKELRWMAVFRKVLQVQHQIGSLSLLVFHPECWNFWVVSWKLWANTEHSSKEPNNVGFTFGNLNSMCQPCEPPLEVDRIMRKQVQDGLKHGWARSEEWLCRDVDRGPLFPMAFRGIVVLCFYSLVVHKISEFFLCSVQWVGE